MPISKTERPLSDEQLMRYSRHIMLPSMDIDGQERLWNARVLIIGLGGLGCAVSQYLAASGIGTITLVDDDTVDKTNLQRQVLHGESKVGQEKVESARASLSAINSEIEIKTINQRLTGEALTEQVKSHDLVLDCCDNLATRNEINRACFKHKVPLVSGAAIRMEGQVISFLMSTEAPDSPCYACVSSLFGEQSLTCSESGILSPVVGIIGTIQATESLKILAKIGEPLSGKLLMLDAATMSFNTFNVNKLKQCPVCGEP